MQGRIQHSPLFIEHGMTEDNVHGIRRKPLGHPEKVTAQGLHGIFLQFLASLKKFGNLSLTQKMANFLKIAFDYLKPLLEV